MYVSCGIEKAWICYFACMSLRAIAESRTITLLIASHRLNVVHLVRRQPSLTCHYLRRVHAQVANLEAFDTERSISLVPPDGEFALANYRTSHALRLPFRLSISTESDPASDHKVGACGRRQIMLIYMCGQMTAVRQQCSMVTGTGVGWAHAHNADEIDVRPSCQHPGFHVSGTAFASISQ
jgi:hypothetical protein